MLAVRGDPTVLREAALRASALLLVTKGWQACASPREVNRLMPKGQWFRSQRELRMATGGGREVARRVATGGVIPLGSLGKWSPDFWAGLRASGAVKPSNRPQQWILESPGAHHGLVEALLGEVPFRISWSMSSGMLAMWGLWAARMGADDPHGVGVLAGLLAGGWRVERAGESWLAVAWKGTNASVLDRHLIPMANEGRNGKGMLMVSPFWGALLAGEMPRPVGEWFRLWGGRKAMCPLLPWAFLAHAWGDSPGKARGMVPFAVDGKAMWSAGIGTRQGKVRRLAFERLGMTGVGREVRAAWLRGLAARGVTAEDFPVGKVPLDFEGQACHDAGSQGEEGQT